MSAPNVKGIPTTKAKGCFPGRLRRKTLRKRAKFRKVEKAQRWREVIGICHQITKNLTKFKEIFPDINVEDFVGFSSEECGLQAYRKLGSKSANGPDVIRSIDFDSKSVLTRLSSHARHSSLNDSDSEDFVPKKVKKRKKLQKLQNATVQIEDCFSKPSPIKPAKFIVPPRIQKPALSNVTPTFLKFNKKGAGHPDELAKALISRANKKRVKIPSTPGSSSSESPMKQHKRKFILPTKSSRSSRIIKANRKYMDDDSHSSTTLESGDSPAKSLLDMSNESIKTLNAIAMETYQYPDKIDVPNKVTKNKDTSKPKYPEGRPLLKEPTFRMAGLDSINNKKQLPRVNSSYLTQRSRKLIKRAKFKHPTSSSQLILGSDVKAKDKENKRSVIREATFKPPTQQVASLSPKKDEVEKGELSRFGYDQSFWDEICSVNEASSDAQWSTQEIHNLLHGCHVFGALWSKITKYYSFKSKHKNSTKLKQKAVLLQNQNLLDGNFKVEGSVFASLIPIFVLDNSRELQSPSSPCNKKKVEADTKSTEENNSSRPFSPNSRLQDCLSSPKRNAKNISLGLSEEDFNVLISTKRNLTPWKPYELHNVLHGVHYFGLGRWTFMTTLYKFHPKHNPFLVRNRYKMLHRLHQKKFFADGKVRDEVMDGLMPRFTAMGRNFFKKMIREGREFPDSAQKKINRKPRTERGDDGNKMQMNQAHHAFGSAPFWEDGNASPVMDALTGRMENHSALSSMTGKPNARKKLHKKFAEGSNVDGATSESDQEKKQNAKKSGPRIKHVCRRASLVTGMKPATTEAPHLTALPRTERERIAKEIFQEQITSSSEEESDIILSPKSQTKRSISKRDRDVSIPAKKQKVSDKCSGDRTQCGSCKSCMVPACGECAECARTGNKSCLSRSPCEYLKVQDDKITRNDVGSRPSTRNLTRLNETHKNSEITATPYRSILSPDSKYKLIQSVLESELPIIKLDSWKNRYDINALWDSGGTALITSTTPCTRWLCFLCGSAGLGRHCPRNAKEVPPLFIFCNSCCAPFHPFCLDDQENEDAIEEAKNGVWICKRCHYCRNCGHIGNLLECRTCRKTYHSDCLPENYPSKPSSENHVWLCMKCVRCKSCGSSRPGQHPGASWTHDFQLCERCGDLFDKGNFCPVCRKCYRDEDFDTRMVQCGKCRRWVHSRCENLTVENYTLLSHMPDSIRYVCPDCDGRRTKAEQECEISGTSSDEDPSGSLEGDKIRNMLMKILPEPPWRQAINDELQAGLEQVTMALFQSKMPTSILEGNGNNEIEGQRVHRPNDLFAIRFEVHNRRYTTVAEFSSDVCNILKMIRNDGSGTETESADECERPRRHKQRTSLKDTYYIEMRKVFPWFDIDTGRVKDCSDVPDGWMPKLWCKPQDNASQRDLLPNATMPPNPDHEYAQWQDRAILSWSGGPDTPVKSPWGGVGQRDQFGGMAWCSMSPGKLQEDLRQCLFCGKYGDETENNAGRMLYCGQDDWVHVNCALWSAEVFEQNDGSLQNVHLAISRGRMMKCEGCKLPGATVGCNTRDCPKNFHFMCARNAQCVFLYNKKVFCVKHRSSADSQVLKHDAFEVLRRVVVDNDDMRPNKKWQKGIPAESITVLFGSVMVHRLGKLSLSSDSKENLIPVNYRITRCFWSAMHAGRRTIYTITVSETKPQNDPQTLSQSGNKTQQVANDNHHTISHADDTTKESNVVKPVVNPTIGSCKRNLFEKVASTSPTSNNQSNFGPKGTYVIMSSLNTTLPQSITPLPALQNASSPSTKTTPVFKNEIAAVSPDNPFVNTKLLKSQDTNTIPNVTRHITSTSVSCTSTINSVVTTDRHSITSAVEIGTSGSILQCKPEPETINEEILKDSVKPCDIVTKHIDSKEMLDEKPKSCDLDSKLPSLLQKAKEANLDVDAECETPNAADKPKPFWKQSNSQAVNKKDSSYNAKIEPMWRKTAGQQKPAKPMKTRSENLNKSSENSKKSSPEPDINRPMTRRRSKSENIESKNFKSINFQPNLQICKLKDVESRTITTNEINTTEEINKKHVMQNGEAEIPKDNLFKVPDVTTRSTRSRSRSHDVTSTSMMQICDKKSLQKNINVVSLTIDKSPNTPKVKIYNGEEKTDKQSPTDKRRYPRRNSFTCLKSFSGLSPNYAIASYQPNIEKIEQAKLNKQNKKSGNIKKPIIHYPRRTRKMSSEASIKDTETATIPEKNALKHSENDCDGIDDNATTKASSHTISNSNRDKIKNSNNPDTIQHSKENKTNSGSENSNGKPKVEEKSPNRKCISSTLNKPRNRTRLSKIMSESNENKDLKSDNVEDENVKTLPSTNNADDSIEVARGEEGDVHAQKSPITVVPIRTTTATPTQQTVTAVSPVMRIMSPILQSPVTSPCTSSSGVNIPSPHIQTSSKAFAPKSDINLSPLDPRTLEVEPISLQTHPPPVNIKRYSYPVAKPISTSAHNINQIVHTTSTSKIVNNHVAEKCNVLSPINLNANNTLVSNVQTSSKVTEEKESVMLDQMIEFYSNKNNLSDWEKAIVRTLIKSQMQNQKTTSGPIPNFSSKNSLSKPQSKPNVKRKLSNEADAVNKRAKHDITHELTNQKQKTLLKRKNACGSKSEALFSYCGCRDKPMTWFERDYHSVLKSCPSPLLYIYKNAILVENQSTKACREMLAQLNKKGIQIDVPWATNRLRNMKKLKKISNKKHPQLMYHITSDDGYSAQGADLNELICALLDAVQECRENSPLPCPVMCFDAVMDMHDFLGTSHDAVRFLVEQLPGARHCSRYQAKYYKHREPLDELVTHINPHGCARAEQYRGRSKPDMFSFLASKHRLPPTYDPSKSQNNELMQRSTRRATSMELPMAMRFRHLKTFSRECVGVYRSLIHGRGLYCKRDIDEGEMIMEYTGQVIRSMLTDRREQKYESKGIGCYMFRMDDHFVIDATLLGSAARFINHSCEPNCFSRIVTIEGKKHIVIFALRSIHRGEELTYDYKFPIEDDEQKISCNCGSKSCRKFMN